MEFVKVRLSGRSFEIAVVLMLTLIPASGQVTTGEISGTVSDPSKAPVPSAIVSVINEETSLARSALSNAEGLYLAKSLPPGRYTVKINQPGFKVYEIKGVVITAGARIPLNPALEVGSVTETVSVSAAPEMVETNSGTMARLVDSQQAVNMPLNQRNLYQLLVTVPGVQVENKNQMSAGPIGEVYGIHVNGLRSMQTAYTLDGSVNQDISHQNLVINNVSPDFVQEVKITQAGQGAELGRGAGAQVNYVTKSGTEQFHGSLFEFYRSTSLNARDFFLPQRSFILAHDFGWTIGGPVLIPKLLRKNGNRKVFFFAGQDYRRRISPKTGQDKIPTLAERQGIMSSATTLRYPTNFSIASLRGQPIMDPSRATPDNPTGRNILPQQYMGEVGKAVMKVYDAVQPKAALYHDVAAPNNVIFNVPGNNRWREDIVRIDYQHSEKHQIYFRYLFDMQKLYDPTALGNLPTAAGTWDRSNRSLQLSHTWVPSPNKVNELVAQSALYGDHNIYTGDLLNQSYYGITFPRLFGRYVETCGIPWFSFDNYASVPGGRCNPGGNNWDGSVRNNFSWVRGRHNLRIGGIAARIRRNIFQDFSLTGNIGFRSTSQYSTGNSLVDLFLGNYATYNQADTIKTAYPRFSQYELYVADTWKVTSRFTLDYGLRYYHIAPGHTIDNGISTFLPNVFDPAKAQQVYPSGPTAGQIIPGVGQPYNGIVIPGDNFPIPHLAPTDPLATSLFHGLPRGISNPSNHVAPRVGFAYDATGRGTFAVRGAIGVGYERYGDFSLVWDLPRNPPFVHNVTLTDGNLTNISGGQKAAQYATNMTGYQPDMGAPVVYNWNFGVQVRAPFQSLLDVSYVSTQARHMMRRVNINKVDPARRMAHLGADLNSLRQYSGYADINMYETSGISSYHAFQTSLTKRYSKNLTYSAVYTWGKALTDAEDPNSTPEDSGNFRPERSYARSNRPHVFNASFVYQLPFYSAQKGVAGRILGGWQVSSIISAESGKNDGIWCNTLIGGRRCDRVGNLTYLNPREVHTFVSGDGTQVTGNFFFDPTPGLAFVKPPEDRYGNSAPNIMKGPSFWNIDLAIAKILNLHEKLSLQLRGEMFNALNHANFTGVGSYINDRDFGVVSGSYPARQIQLAAKLLF